MGATLDQSYRHLTRLHQHHDPSSATATARLPAVTRHHVHALVGFAAHTRSVAAASGGDRRAALGALGAALAAGVDAGSSDDLVLRAVVHTHRAYALDVAVWAEHLDGLLALEAPGPGPSDDRQTAARRLATLVVPVLEPTDGRAATHIGDLAAAAALTRALALGSTSPAGAEARPRTIARARRLLVSADIGMAWLPPSSARAVRAHRTLLAATLDRLERTGPDAGPRGARPSLGARAVARWGWSSGPGGHPPDEGPPTGPHGW